MFVKWYWELIIGFAMKCKFKVCFLTPTKKEGMGVPNGLGQIHKQKFKVKSFFITRKKIVSEN